MTQPSLPWAPTPAEHSFEAFPPMETFQDLTKAHLAR